MLNIVHCTASPCFGGPERQMIELARSLEQTHSIRHVFVSFAEGGNCEPFFSAKESKLSGFLTALSKKLWYANWHKTL